MLKGTKGWALSRSRMSAVIENKIIDIKTAAKRKPHSPGACHAVLKTESNSRSRHASRRATGKLAGGEASVASGNHRNHEQKPVRPGGAFELQPPGFPPPHPGLILY